METENFSTIVAQIYDCITDPSGWPAVLSRIAEGSDSKIITLAVLDTEQKTARFSAAYGEPSILDPLISTYSAQMPFYHVLHRFELDEPLDFDGLCRLHGPNGRDVWDNSSINKEWAEPNRLRMGANLLVMKRDNLIGGFNTLTDADRPITPESMNLVRLLSPHIRRAVSIGGLLEIERSRAAVFQQIIDGLAHPVVIVAKDMRLLHANLAAETLLGAGALLRIADGRLSASYEPAQSALVSSVAVANRSEVDLGPAGLDVPLMKIDRPSVAYVFPLTRRSDRSWFTNDAAAAIFVTAPGIAPMPAIDAVASLFGLTAAEKRVAARVADGKTRAEIAAETGVSDYTVKIQLGAIFDKTGTGDQRELQNLVRDLTPPARPPETWAAAEAKSRSSMRLLPLWMGAAAEVGAPALVNLPDFPVLPLL